MATQDPSATDWRPYHSALSQCAELLDNMSDADSIFDVPKFLAAKLASIAGAAKGGSTKEAWEYSFIHSSAIGHGDSEIGPCLTYDRSQAFGVGCIKQREVAISERATKAEQPPAPAPSAVSIEPTDLSKRLRDYCSKFVGDYSDLMRQAADEIERYYGGMLAWKKTAEKKDADWQAERMGRVDDRIAARNAAAPPEPSPVEQALVPDDGSFLQVIQERDRYHDMADKLADGIAEHFDADIGEHSSANCPWSRALEILNTKPEFAPCAGSQSLAVRDTQATQSSDAVLIQALKDIANPIAAMQRDVPEDYTFDGRMAVQMASSPEWYKQRAQEALDDISRPSSSDAAWDAALEEAIKAVRDRAAPSDEIFVDDAIGVIRALKRPASTPTANRDAEKAGGLSWDHATMGLPNEEVAGMWRASGHSGTVPFSFANRIQERMQAVLRPTAAATPTANGQQGGAA